MTGSGVGGTLITKAVEGVGGGKMIEVGAT